MNLIKILNEIPSMERTTCTLRKLEEEDAYELYQYYKNPQVHRYLDWYGPQSQLEAKKIVNTWNKGFEEGWILRLAIADKVSGKIIGTVFLNNFEDHRAELGYELSKEHWNRGIMTDAIQGVLNLGFEMLGLSRIQAFVRKENTASRKVLEKLNFKNEGYLRQYERHLVTGQMEDMFIYGLIKEEYSFKQN